MMKSEVRKMAMWVGKVLTEVGSPGAESDRRSCGALAAGLSEQPRCENGGAASLGKLRERGMNKGCR